MTPEQEARFQARLAEEQAQQAPQPKLSRGDAAVKAKLGITPATLAADNEQDLTLGNIDELEREIKRTKPGPEQDILIAEHNRIKARIPPEIDPAMEAKFKARLAEEKKASSKMFVPSGEKNYDWLNAENIQAHPIYQGAQGVASTGKGLLQLSGMIGDKIHQAIGSPLRAGAWLNDKLKQSAENAHGGEMGTDEFNWGETAGSMFDPAAIAGGNKIAAAKGVVKKALAGTAVGGAIGLAQPSYKDTEEEQIQDRLEHGGFGAGVGGSLPVAGALLKGVGRGVRDITDLVTPGGAGRIADRYIKSTVGDKTTQPLIDALDASRNVVPNRVPTSAQAVSHLPEGSPVAAMEKISASQPEGISAEFGHRFADQQEARVSALEKLINRRKSAGGGITVGTGEKSKVAQALLDTLIDPATKKERPLAFLKALEQDDDFVKKTIDIRKNLDQVFSKKELKSIMAVAETLGQKIRVEKPNQVTNLQGGLSIAEETRTHFPNLLSRPAMLANWMLKMAATSKTVGVETRVNKEMAERLLSTSDFAKALRALPPSKTGQVVDALVAHGIPRAAIVEAQQEDQ